jgi:hypothetical protein
MWFRDFPVSKKAYFYPINPTSPPFLLLLLLILLHFKSLQSVFYNYF